MEPRSRGKGQDGGAGNATVERDAPGTPIPCPRPWKVVLVWVCVGVVSPGVAETARRKMTRTTK